MPHPFVDLLRERRIACLWTGLNAIPACTRFEHGEEVKRRLRASHFGLGSCWPGPAPVCPRPAFP